jgi:hypothetical protein
LPGGRRDERRENHRVVGGVRWVGVGDGRPLLELELARGQPRPLHNEHPVGVVRVAVDDVVADVNHVAHRRFVEAVTCAPSRAAASASAVSVVDRTRPCSRMW